MEHTHSPAIIAPEKHFMGLLQTERYSREREDYEKENKIVTTSYQQSKHPRYDIFKEKLLNGKLKSVNTIYHKVNEVLSHQNRKIIGELSKGNIFIRVETGVKGYTKTINIGFNKQDWSKH